MITNVNMHNINGFYSDNNKIENLLGNLSANKWVRPHISLEDYPSISSVWRMAFPISILESDYEIPQNHSQTLSRDMFKITKCHNVT